MGQADMRAAMYALGSQFPIPVPSAPFTDLSQVKEATLESGKGPCLSSFLSTTRTFLRGDRLTHTAGHFLSIMLPLLSVHSRLELSINFSLAAAFYCNHSALGPRFFLVMSPLCGPSIKSSLICDL